MYGVRVRKKSAELALLLYGSPYVTSSSNRRDASIGTQELWTSWSYDESNDAPRSRLSGDFGLQFRDKVFQLGSMYGSSHK